MNNFHEVMWPNWGSNSLPLNWSQITNLTAPPGLTPLSQVMRKPVFGVSDQVRLKLACSATETNYSLEILDTETRGIILSKQWTTKVLIRLRRCTGWSAPLLFAYGKNRFSHDMAHMMTYLITPVPRKLLPYTSIIIPSAASYNFPAISSFLSSKTRAISFRTVAVRGWCTPTSLLVSLRSWRK